MIISVVVAHPDDEVLGCGGTIARLTQEKNLVYITILGEGVTSRYPSRNEANADLVQQLRAQSREVAHILGATDIFFHDLPDNRFDTLPLLDVVKIIEESVERLHPDVIYTNHMGDLNIDHQITGRAVLTATRPTPGQSVRDIYCFEVPSSTEWGFQRIEPAFQPSVFVDISATIGVKIQAMGKYVGESRPFPHPRSPEALQAIARRWGSVAGVTDAEAFELIRSIR